MEIAVIKITQYFLGHSIIIFHATRFNLFQLIIGTKQLRDIQGVV